jgi:trehalose 2-sulfotransferase
MNRIPEIFDYPVVDQQRLDELSAMPDPRRRYLIAMTPRSGSSYLCDVMRRTRRLGRPGEVLNQEFIPGIMKKTPGRTPEEYLRNIVRVRMTRNGVSGLKASWFQFENFIAAMGGNACLGGFQYVFLTRRDVAAQAVSLYKATASSVFHTNVRHGEEALDRLASLTYDFDEINRWYEHIVRQESGWRKYFLEQDIVPLPVTYEEITENILDVLKRMAVFIGIPARKVAMPRATSVFEKIGDAQNIEWAQRFARERRLWAHPSAAVRT